MLVAMGCNGALLLKLADRLHDMRTLGALPAAKRNRLAQETLDVWAPLANRLGVWNLKAQLEDLAFKQLYPGQVRACLPSRPLPLASLYPLPCCGWMGQASCIALGVGLASACVRLIHHVLHPHHHHHHLPNPPPSCCSTLSCAAGWSRCSLQTCWWAWWTACGLRCSARTSGVLAAWLAAYGVHAGAVAGEQAGEAVQSTSGG